MTEPTNLDRTEWAEGALRQFLNDMGEPSDRELLEDDVVDLIADLFHFARLNKGKYFIASPQQLFERAAMHFEAEVDEEKIQ